MRLPLAVIAERQHTRAKGRFGFDNALAFLDALGLGQARREAICGWQTGFDMKIGGVVCAVESERRRPEILVADVAVILAEEAGIGIGRRRLHLDRVAE